MQYLQNYIHDTTDLPAELLTRFRRLAELDAQAAAVQSGSNAACQEFVTKATGAEGPAAVASVPGRAQGRPSVDDRAALLQRLDQDCQQASQLANDQVACAQAMYDCVDRHIQAMDAETKRLDAELRAERLRAGLPEQDAGAAEAALHELVHGNGRRRRGSQIRAQAVMAGHMASKVPAAAQVAVDMQRPGELQEYSAAGTWMQAAVDPAEPRYCYCQNVSFGEMVACDNDACPIEWFHYECVGLAPGTEAPERWYCRECTSKLAAAGKL